MVLFLIYILYFLVFVTNPQQFLQQCTQLLFLKQNLEDISKILMMDKMGIWTILNEYLF